MNTHAHMRQGKAAISIIVFLVLIILGLGGYIFWKGRADTNVDNVATTTPPVTDAPADNAWQAYRSAAYNVEFQYPPGWTVFEGKLADTITPAINVYKKGTQPPPPYTHWSEVTHVSIFPNGVPTEGLITTTVETDVVLQETVKRALDYTLEDGARFATMLTFTNPPRDFEYGFVWAGLAIEDKQPKYLRDGQEISELEFDIFAGDEVVFSGTVSAADRELQKDILATLRFIR